MDVVGAKCAMKCAMTSERSITPEFPSLQRTLSISISGFHASPRTTILSIFPSCSTRHLNQRWMTVVERRAMRTQARVGGLCRGVALQSLSTGVLQTTSRNYREAAFCPIAPGLRSHRSNRQQLHYQTRTARHRTLTGLPK